MKRQPNVSRRRALKVTAFSGSALLARHWAALADGKLADGKLAHGNTPSDRVRIGVIGVGVRGKYLIGNLPPGAEVTAICDCSTARIAETLRPQEKRFVDVLSDFCQSNASRCATYQDYRQMIDREQLDAVIIATADHHHVQAAMLALDAGLDVYLEKPLSVTVREGRMLVEQVKHTGRILQVGSQQRSMEMNRFACQFIRDGGLGKVDHIDFPNFPGPFPAPRYPQQPTPEGLHWDLFLGPTPNRPYHRKLWDKDQFKVGDLVWRGWDLHREFSGHLMTNWGAHSIDMVQYALGMDASGPISLVPQQECDENALRRDWQRKWHKKTPAPVTTFTAELRFRPVTLKYLGGTELRLRPDIDAATFYGERGSMIISRNRFKADPPDIVKDPPDPKLAERWNGSGFVARPHLENWLECVRHRGQPHAPVEVGHRTATVCHLINLARELDRPLAWDPVAETFKNDDEACQFLGRPRRAGWQLPETG